jgi:hypothetical protein
MECHFRGLERDTRGPQPFGQCGSLLTKALASASGDNTVRTMTGACKQTFKTSVKISNLLFSDDCRYLKTDKALLSLDSGSFGTSFHPDQPIYAVSINDEWVKRNGQNLLWFPPDYRSSCLTVLNNMLVLGHTSGHVTFLEFASS